MEREEEMRETRGGQFGEGGMEVTRLQEEHICNKMGCRLAVGT